MKIIGLSGTNGAGKDTVAELLAEEQGWLFADATTMFVAELTKRGLPTDRPHKSALSAEWRRELGMAVIVDKAVEMFKQGNYPGVVVSSLRHPGEADRVHELGGQVIWVDADPQVRYQRIQTNAAARGRHVEDVKSFADFLADEVREMTPVGDAATLNMAAVKQRADLKLLNNGADLAAFKQAIRQALDLA